MVHATRLSLRRWSAWVVSVILTLGTGALGSIPDDDHEIIHHWALLIAGSRGWGSVQPAPYWQNRILDHYIRKDFAVRYASRGHAGNYRHQADVAHAYHVLMDGGMPKERIIVMMEDDIAYHRYNPLPGKVYNCPGCEDVYHDLKVDYSSVDVNATNFLSVLAGDAKAMQGIGTGRVVASGPHDRVFVYYTDHGAPDISVCTLPLIPKIKPSVPQESYLVYTNRMIPRLVAMPHGRPLFADELVDTLRAKYYGGGFFELVFFMEACESGSMFRGMLHDNIPVFATTAANATESSWATYCPTHVVPRNHTAKHPTDHLDTCLGDLYSVSWIELSEEYNLHHWSLQKEFERVRDRTSNHLTFRHGSHAEEFGRRSIAKEHASNFEGFHKRTAPHHPQATTRSPSDYTNIAQRDADLLHLRLAAAANEGHLTATSDADSMLNSVLENQGLRGAGSDSVAVDHEGMGPVNAQEELKMALEEYKREDSAMLSVYYALYEHSDLSWTLWGFNEDRKDADNLFNFVGMFAKQNDDERAADGLPLVDSWECLKAFVSAYVDSCGEFTSHTASHMWWVVELCNYGVPWEDWGTYMARACEPRVINEVAHGSTVS